MYKTVMSQFECMEIIVKVKVHKFTVDDPGAVSLHLLSDPFSYASSRDAALRATSPIQYQPPQHQHHQQQWLPSRQKHLLQIVDPNTGNEVLIDSPHQRICDQPSAASTTAASAVVSSDTDRVSGVFLLMISETVSALYCTYFLVCVVRWHSAYRSRTSDSEIAGASPARTAVE